jgi:hypothetical protein
MVSPLRNSPDPSVSETIQIPSSRAPDRAPRPAAAEPRPDLATGDDDLQQLESSLRWLKRQSMVVRREEAGYRARGGIRRLPPAAQLPPVCGIAAPEAEASPRSQGRSPSEVAPPRAWERLQLPRPRRRNDLRGALGLLIAGVIAGSLAYHIASGGLLSASEPAQAASQQAR